MTGYSSRQYADSFRDIGEPYLLPRSQGWLLVREIPGSGCRDAMGCYPLFACRDWSGLSADLLDLENQLVSVVMVPDPFADHSPRILQSTFDVVVPFKDHLVVDLENRPERAVSKHHRYYARKALREVSVEVSERPVDFLDEWQALYDNLVDRHRFGGIRRFSREAFALQLAAPGIVMFRALHAGESVGVHLWFVHGSTATSHLTAFSPVGYKLSVSYALYWEAIRFFAGTTRWLNLGGAAGIRDEPEDGLRRFKAGWSSSTRTACLCGRILDRDLYRELTTAGGHAAEGYFPAYRAGEAG